MLRTLGKRGAAALAQVGASAARGGQAGTSSTSKLTWETQRLHAGATVRRHLSAEAAKAEHPARSFFAGAAILAAASAGARVLFTRQALLTTFIGVPLAVRRQTDKQRRGPLHAPHCDSFQTGDEFRRRVCSSARSSSRHLPRR